MIEFSFQTRVPRRFCAEHRTVKFCIERKTQVKATVFRWKRRRLATHSFYASRLSPGDRFSASRPSIRFDCIPGKALHRFSIGVPSLRIENADTSRVKYGVALFMLLTRDAIDGQRVDLGGLVSIATRYWKDSPSLRGGVQKCVDAMASKQILIGAGVDTFYFAMDSRERLSSLTRDSIAAMLGYAKPRQSEIALGFSAEVKLFRRDLAMLLFLDRKLRFYRGIAEGGIPMLAVSSSVKRYWVDQDDARRMLGLAIKRMKAEKLITVDPDWNISIDPLLSRFPTGLSPKDGLSLVCKWTDIYLLTGPVF